MVVNWTGLYFDLEGQAIESQNWIAILIRFVTGCVIRPNEIEIVKTLFGMVNVIGTMSIGIKTMKSEMKASFFLESELNEWWQKWMLLIWKALISERRNYMRRKFLELIPLLSHIRSHWVMLISQFFLVLHQIVY